MNVCYKQNTNMLNVCVKRRVNNIEENVSFAYIVHQNDCVKFFGFLTRYLLVPYDR